MVRRSTLPQTCLAVDAVEDCAAQAAAKQVGTQQANTGASVRWLACCFDADVSVPMASQNAGRASIETVAARLMRAVTTGRLAMLVHSEQQQHRRRGDNSQLAALRTWKRRWSVSCLPGYQSVSSLPCSCLGCEGRRNSEQADGGNGAAAAQATVDVDLRELGSLYHNWATWTGGVDDSDEWTTN